MYYTDIIICVSEIWCSVDLHVLFMGGCCAASSPQILTVFHQGLYGFVILPHLNIAFSKPVKIQYSISRVTRTRDMQKPHLSRIFQSYNTRHSCTWDKSNKVMDWCILTSNSIWQKAGQSYNFCFVQHLTYISINVPSSNQFHWKTSELLSENKTLTKTLA